MDITMVGQDITEDTEDTMDGADTTDTPTDTWENALLMPNPKLMPKLPLRLMPLHGIMVATMDTPTDTDTTVWDTVDTTDILTTTDTVTLENALLMLNLKLMPNPRLRLLPGMDTMVDTMVIPTTEAITDMEADTMVVTGGNLTVTIPSKLV